MQTTQEASMQDEEMETADSHQRSQAHLLKEKEFQRYKDIYLKEVYPCLIKEDELRRKMDEGVSSSGEKRGLDGVSLDLERLERCHSTVNNEVQKVESSLNWTNTTLLLRVVEDLKAELQKIDKVLEQGILTVLHANLVSLQRKRILLTHDFFPPGTTLWLKLVAVI